MSLRLAGLLLLALALPAAAGDGYVVVVPKGDTLLRRAIAPLVAHRRADGLTVSIREGGTPAETTRAVQAGKPRYALIVGSAQRLPGVIVAKAYTDRPFGDIDGDGFPEVSLGRIPFDEPAVVNRIAKRIVAYEARPGDGPWRKQCALVAGEGRFSPGLDKIIEEIFQSVVTNKIPLRYDIDLTYANPRSPYCYPPKQFSARVAQRLNEGALVYAYVGHGQVTSLDDLQVPNPRDPRRPLRFPILNTQTAKTAQAADAPPIFLAIACWTAKFEEARRASVGMTLLRAPGGPIAFFGSTRISHPVPNAVLAKELIQELFVAKGVVRLGPALDRARYHMVKGRWDASTIKMKRAVELFTMTLGADKMKSETQRHVDMYVLFGDPALKVARPEAGITLETTIKGNDLHVRGTLPFDAPGVTVRLEVPRGMSAAPSDPNATAVERYARANDRTVQVELVRIRSGRTFATTLRFPPTRSAARYVVKAFAEANGRCASAGVAIERGR